MFSTKCRTCALAHNCHFWFRDRKESEECRYYVFKQDSCPFSRDVDGEVFCVAKKMSIVLIAIVPNWFSRIAICWKIISSPGNCNNILKI